MAINTTKIKEDISQIKGTVDKEAHKVLAEFQASSLNKAMKEIQKVQSELAPYLQLMSLPPPSPGDIVSWLGKLATATAAPQIKAQVKCVIDLTSVAKAIADVQAAIREAQAEISKAEAEINAALAPLNEVAKEVDKAINDAMSEVAKAQASINSIAGANLVNFDTSSVNSFLASVDEGIPSLNSAINSILGDV